MKINLIPQDKISKQGLSIKTVWVVYGVFLALLLGASSYNALVNYQTKEKLATIEVELTSQPNKAMTIVEMKQKKVELNNKKAILDKLKTSNPSSLDTLNGIIQNVPDGVLLTKLTIKDNEASISGEAKEYANFNTFTTMLKDNKELPYLSIVNATKEINNQQEFGIVKFELKLNKTLPQSK